MGELPHPCSVCGKKFALAESLKKHMRAVHLKSRGYSCPYCDYAASRADMLKIHVRKIHTKDWSYTCQYCQASGTAFCLLIFCLLFCISVLSFLPSKLKKNHKVQTFILTS
jgi:DNA-directed RNA polymerase subunit RPC12/RpoP